MHLDLYVTWYFDGKNIWIYVFGSFCCVILNFNCMDYKLKCCQNQFKNCTKHIKDLIENRGKNTNIRKKIGVKTNG